MTPRERVRAAFQHCEPDRTPLFEREIKPPSDSVILGRPAVHQHNWPEYMRVWAQDGWEAVMSRTAEDEFELAWRLGLDMIRLSLNPGRGTPPPEPIDELTYRHGDAVRRYHPESGVVENLTERETSHADAEADFRRRIESEPSPFEVSEDQLFVARRIQALARERGLDVAYYASAYAIPVAALPAFALEWFITARELLDRYYEKQSDYVIGFGRLMADEGCDIIGLGGDFAGDTGPVVSPRTYREQVAPHIRRQSDALHEYGAWTTNTTDGYLWDVLDDFLSGAGVDGYGEIDVAAGMELARLKREWPEHVFLGNLDIRHVLCSGTPEEARRHMIQCIEDGWGDGGHVIMTSNVVHEDVRPELYLAAIDAYREHFGLELLEKRSGSIAPIQSD